MHTTITTIDCGSGTMDDKNSALARLTQSYNNSICELLYTGITEPTKEDRDVAEHYCFTIHKYKKLVNNSKYDFGEYKAEAFLNNFKEEMRKRCDGRNGPNNGLAKQLQCITKESLLELSEKLLELEKRYNESIKQL
jgi:hypothetical protein